MTTAVIDTSILVEFLNVPNMNSRHQAIAAEFKRKAAARETLLLPIAAIIETGNHIAQNGDGNQRRQVAGRFVQFVRQALNGDTPFTATPLPGLDEWTRLLDAFPDHAMRKVGLGDVSIIDVYEQQRRLNPLRRVYIWSLDVHLSGYDHQPPPGG